MHLLAAYGAGIQVHVEDLAAHLAGRERGDATVRFGELSRLPGVGRWRQRMRPPRKLDSASVPDDA